MTQFFRRLFTGLLLGISLIPVSSAQSSTPYAAYTDPIAPFWPEIQAAIDSMAFTRIPALLSARASSQSEMSPYQLGIFALLKCEMFMRTNQQDSIYPHLAAYRAAAKQLPALDAWRWRADYFEGVFLFERGLKGKARTLIQQAIGREHQQIQKDTARLVLAMISLSFNLRNPENSSRGLANAREAYRLISQLDRKPSLTRKQRNSHAFLKAQACKEMSAHFTNLGANKVNAQTVLLAGPEPLDSAAKYLWKTEEFWPKADTLGRTAIASLAAGYWLNQGPYLDKALPYLDAIQETNRQYPDWPLANFGTALEQRSKYYYLKGDFKQTAYWAGEALAWHRKHTQGKVVQSGPLFMQAAALYIQMMAEQVPFTVERYDTVLTGLLNATLAIEPELDTDGLDAIALPHHRIHDLGRYGTILDLRAKAFFMREKTSKDPQDLMAMLKIAVESCTRNLQQIQNLHEPGALGASLRAKKDLEALTYMAAVKLCEQGYCEEVFPIVLQLSLQYRNIFSRRYQQMRQLARGNQVPDSLLSAHQKLQQQYLSLQRELEHASGATHAQINQWLFETHNKLDSLRTKLDQYPAWAYTPPAAPMQDFQQWRNANCQAGEALIFVNRLADYATNIFVLTADTLGAVSIKEKPDQLSLTLSHINQYLEASLQADRPGQSLLQDSLGRLGHHLYQQLWQPIQEAFPSLPNKIILLPDAYSEGIPFELMITEAPTSGASHNWSFFALKNQISYQRTLSSPDRRSITPDRLVTSWVGIAPVFSSQSARPSQSSLRGSRNLDTLRYNTPEVQEIARMLGFAAHTQTQCSPTEFVPLLRQKDVIHLATHAWGDSSHYEESYIVLGENDPDRSALKFPLLDILQEDLDNEMVVLSGCNTNFGEQLQGEGLGGIGQAFLTAGAKSVVGTQWAVDDQATYELMRYFYEGLKMNMAKDEALLYARQTYMRLGNPTKLHPLYWASFRVYGDRTPIQFGISWWTIGSILLVSGLLIWLITTLLSNRQKRT